MPRRNSSATALTDLHHLIDRTLNRLSKMDGGLKLPIDLSDVCRVVGVEWEFRWMIPEGVTAVVDDKLKIFLRSNFSDEKATDRRQRFTWAHEICHTLFYDLTVVPPRAAEDSPTGPGLEALCQRGARYLLMPPEFMSRQFDFANPLSTVNDVVALTESYGVSYEVALRRLQDMRECVRGGYALILLRNQNGGEYIEASAHDIWLQTLLPIPSRGQRFDEWARPFMDDSLQVAPDEWEKERVTLRLQQVSRSLTLAEIKQK